MKFPKKNYFCELSEVNFLLNSGKKHPCFICGKDLSRPDKLKLHMLHVHKQDADGNPVDPEELEKDTKKHLCGICSKGFR